MPDPGYSDADIEAAISALSQPGRLRGAQELLARAAPRLHAILDDSLSQGGWFDQAHDQAVREATGSDDPVARATAVRTLIAEETRLGMFVGVAVGFELARELGYASAVPPPADASGEPADSSTTTSTGASDEPPDAPATSADASRKRPNAPATSAEALRAAPDAPATAPTTPKEG